MAAVSGGRLALKSLLKEQHYCPCATHSGETDVWADGVDTLPNRVCGPLSSVETPSILLFATRWNNQLPVFVSQFPDDVALDADTLLISWVNMLAIYFPPYHSLFSPTLQDA